MKLRLDYTHSTPRTHAYEYGGPMPIVKVWLPRSVYKTHPASVEVTLQVDEKTNALSTQNPEEVVDEIVDSRSSLSEAQ